MIHWCLLVVLTSMPGATSDSTIAVRPSDERPLFSDYAANEALLGPPVPVDLSSHPQGRTFRTVLREGTKTAPNFAGSYSLVVWGCGSPCQTFAIVDRRSGRIIEWRYSVLGVDFRSDSRLLVVNPIDSENKDLADHLGAKTQYYLLDNGSLSELRRK